MPKKVTEDVLLGLMYAAHESYSSDGGPIEFYKQFLDEELLMDVLDQTASAYFDALNKAIMSELSDPSGTSAQQISHVYARAFLATAFDLGFRVGRHVYDANPFDEEA